MVVIDYSPQYGKELVRMWRDSFEQAVGVKNPYPLEDQLQYLEEQLVPNNRVRIVLADNTSTLVGVLVSSPRTISQLYVHVDHQNRGIGSLLLSLAKQDSDGSLRLFTFDCNLRAQRFYEKHGFKIIGRGFEDQWQLHDIEYEWVAADAEDRADSNRGSGG
jgi:GNAT superfamily N-acetyltransferase